MHAIRWSSWLIVLTAFALVALAACAPASAPAAPTTATIAKTSVPVLKLVGGDNGYPSPFGYTLGPGYLRMSFIFDTLVWKDSQGYIPWLATEWKNSDDGKTWTITLRDGVKWQDGKPLTAADVVFSFEYARKQAFTSPVVRGLDVIASTRQVDEKHVEIALTRSYAPFLAQALASQPIMPRHVWEKVTDPVKYTAPDAVIGSGPYKLLSYDKATGAYLYEANNDFWLGKPYVQRIELVPASDALLALQQGSVDAANIPEGVNDEILTPFKADTFDTITAPGEQTQIIYFNMTKGAPYTDVKFRQAWAYAIDRNEFVKRILLGRGEPGNPGWLPASHAFRNPNVEQYPFDAGKAKALLDAAGYKDANGDGMRELPDGNPMAITLAYLSTSPRPAEMVRDMLKNVGIAITLKSVDRPTLDGMSTSATFDAMITTYGGLASDPDFMRQVFASTSPAKAFWRVQGYKNQRFDDLADQQLLVSDEAKRKPILYEMQSILAQDVPAVALYYPGMGQISRKAVFDAWYYTPGGVAVVPWTWNKQAFVTGNKTGLKIRGQ